MNFTTKHIGYLERDYLSAKSIEFSDLNNSIKSINIDSSCFIKVSGISTLAEEALPELMKDVYAGLHSERISLTYILEGTDSKVNLYIGGHQTSARSSQSATVAHSLSTLITILQSIYPGIELNTLVQEDEKLLMETLKGTLPFYSMAVGTPTIKKVTPKNALGQIDRLIKGLYPSTSNSKWVYSVTADPIEDLEINRIYNITLNELRILNDSSISATNKSPIAERYTDLLKAFLEKVEGGKSLGLWNITTAFGTDNSATFIHGKALIKSIFGGIESSPDPVRMLQGVLPNTLLNPLSHLNIAPPDPPGQVQYPFKYQSLLNSEELSVITNLPQEEMPGYFVKDYARYNVAFSNTKVQTKTIDLGEITDYGRKIGSCYKLNLNELSRHGLIAGTTGSGKTNTVFNIVKQVWSHGVPFLVIEPAKVEYRKLLHATEFANDLQIFTLGDDLTSPFRLNPFEIKPGVSVQTHIDYLKSVFNASFSMFAPLPHVVEQCIHEIYEDKGWDLITGQNNRGLHKYSQPTLTDLYRKIAEVVDRLDYEEKISQDIKAALKTRINSLRIGSKGIMLDTELSTPFDILMSKPTIIELEQIGDDEEKAFLIGLLLMFLNEHYQLQGLRVDGGINHLTIIEEAHRLFKNVPLVSDSEMANMKGKSVETFSNIISEIRAYGEGFLIVEQIPSKLAPDLIKNTNLKIMHRVVAAEDRMQVGATMNLDDQQIRRVATFTVGEACIYSGGDEGAFLVKFENSKEVNPQQSKTEENSLIRTSMHRGDIATEAKLMPGERHLNHYELERRFRNYVRGIVEEPEFKEVLERYVLSVVLYSEALIEEFSSLIQTIQKFRQNLTASNEIISLTLKQGIHNYFTTKGRQYNWAYPISEELENAFQLLVLQVALKNYINPTSLKDFTDEQKNELKWFQEAYQNAAICSYHPFIGCEKVCPNQQCLYRFNVEPFLTDSRVDRNFIDTMAKYNSEEIWSRLIDVSQIVTRRASGNNIPVEHKNKITLCFAIQKSENIAGIDAFLKEKIVNGLINSINI